MKRKIGEGEKQRKTEREGERKEVKSTRKNKANVAWPIAGTKGRLNGKAARGDERNVRKRNETSAKKEKSTAERRMRKGREHEEETRGPGEKQVREPARLIIN